MSFKSQIPNLITLGNLACGVLAIAICAKPEIMLASNINLEGAILGLVGLAFIFDFMDGAVARALKATSPMGAQLDSLSDLVTFGVLPGILCFSIFYPIGMTQDMATDPGMDCFQGIDPLQGWYFPLSLTSFLIPLAAAWRLARFNIDSRPQNVFYGLPAPASGIFFTSLFWIIYQSGLFEKGTDEYLAILAYPPILAGLAILFSILMVSDLPLLSLKFKSFAFKPNLTRYLLLGISLILLIVWFIKAVPAIMVVYFLLSLLDRQLLNRKTE